MILNIILERLVNFECIFRLIDSVVFVKGRMKKIIFLFYNMMLS